MRQLTKSIAAGVGTVALVGGIGAGLAYADTPADDPTTSPSATPTTSATETPMAKPGGKRDENGFRNRFVVLLGWSWNYLRSDRPVRIVAPARQRPP